MTEKLLFSFVDYLCTALASRACDLTRRLGVLSTPCVPRGTGFIANGA